MEERPRPSANKIIAVIRKYTGGSETPLEPEALINIEREQAVEMFSDLARQFGFTGDVPIDSYFDGFRIYLQFPELTPVLRLLYPGLRREWRDAPPRPALSVGHLIAVVQEGVWRDPPPSARAEPMVWVGKKTLTWINNALRPIGYALAYALALTFVWAFGHFLIELVSSVADLDWLAAIGNVVGVVFWGFFLLMIAESTQRHMEARFGVLWDWRRGRLREPRRVPIRS